VDLRGEIMRTVAQGGRLGGARWRSGYIADGIIDLLRRRRLLPKDDRPVSLGGPTLTRKAYAHLPVSQRRQITETLARHRIGWWEWEQIDSTDGWWQVTVWQHHPRGGPLYVLDEDGTVRPGTYIRIIRPQDGD